MKSYIRNQLILIESDYNVYSNKRFLENIQKSACSEKILYFYQKSFMITINIIIKIFNRLIEYIEIMPEEIKNISIMIMQSLKNKFNWISENEIYKYISEFFIRIFKAYFLYPDYNALINSVILSENIKDNLKRIFNVLNKLMSGKFFKNSDEECDFTPFNLFFLEFNPQIFTFCEKLLENKNFTPIENISNTIINNDLNNKININTISIIYSADQIYTLLNIINNNYKIFFDINENYTEKEKEIINDFLKTFQKLKDNEELFINLLKKGKEKNEIFFFAYNEIIYSKKLQDILNRDKNKYFKILELKGDKTTEEVNINKIIRAKNLFFDLLYISPKLSKLTNVATDSKGKNTKEILIKLNKFFKGVSNYKEKKTKDNNIEDTDENINNNEQSKYPKDWYINSLIICLENLDNEYSNNDYKKLYNSIKEDLNKSINNYDFDELGKIVRDLKTITIFKNRFINLQEKNKNVAINIRIREIIENESIEVKILFIYNSKRKIFNITKIENNLNTSLNSSLNNSINSNINNYINNIEEKLSIKCLTINDFIKKFPNFSLIQQRQDIDLFLIEKEVNLSYGLNQYFNIIKTLINIKFTKEERNIVFNKIQKYILIKIYDKIYPRESDKDDMKTFQKTIILSWVRPHHLKLDNIYLDNFIPITTNYIHQLDNEKSPNGKFHIINEIFNAINNVLKFNKGSSFSIDDIAPICEYCLIKAQPERLSSNLKYLQNFISNEGSDLRKMRFVILNNCMNSIKEIDYNKLEGITQDEYNKLCNMARTMTIK